MDLPVFTLNINGIFTNYTFGYHLKRLKKGQPSTLPDSCLVKLILQYNYITGQSFFAISSERLLGLSCPPPIIFEMPRQPYFLVEFTNNQKFSYCEGFHLNKVILSHPNMADHRGFYIPGMYYFCFNFCQNLSFFY